MEVHKESILHKMLETNRATTWTCVYMCETWHNSFGLSVPQSTTNFHEGPRIHLTRQH